MGHHYVPRYYLKGFTNSPDSDLIWRYEKGKTTPICTNTKNVAQENRLYSDEVEKFLAEQVENPANIVLEKIRNFKPLNQDDKFTFSRYMLSMWKRVPEHKSRVKERAPEVIENVIEKLNKEFDELKIAQPDDERKIDQIQSQIKDLIEDRNEYFIQQMWLDNIAPETAPNSVGAISKMSWRIMITDREPYFITCDNPLFFFPWIGIGKPQSEVTFPISSNHALWATWKPGDWKFYSSVRRQIVKEINRRTVYNTTRYLFSHEKLEWINTLLGKETIRLNRIT